MILQAVVALIKVRVHPSEISKLLELCALSATTRFDDAPSWAPKLGIWLPFCCGKMMRRGSRRQKEFVRRFVPWAVARARTATALRERLGRVVWRGAVYDTPDPAFERWAHTAVKGGVRWWINRHIMERWQDVVTFLMATVAWREITRVAGAQPQPVGATHST